MVLSKDKIREALRQGNLVEDVERPIQQTRRLINQGLYTEAADQLTRAREQLLACRGILPSRDSFYRGFMDRSQQEIAELSEQLNRRNPLRELNYVEMRSQVFAYKGQWQTWNIDDAPEYGIKVLELGRECLRRSEQAKKCGDMLTDGMYAELMGINEGTRALFEEQFGKIIVEETE